MSITAAKALKPNESSGHGVGFAGNSPTQMLILMKNLV